MNKGLDALNILWESKQECSTSCNDMCLKCQKAKARDIIEKELKALEIIKTKEINIHALLLHLIRFDIPSGYNTLVGTKYQINQEKYDLLKEVLL